MSESNVCRRLARSYHELAWMNLTADLYNFYESRGDVPMAETEKTLLEEAFSAMLAVLTEATPEETAKGMERLLALRGTVTESVGELSALVDRLMIPEYLLNRTEYAFRSDLPERDTENEARELLQHIFRPEDPVVVNQRIRDMVFQLPVRMTRQRFFDLLQRSLSVYQDGELSALDGFCERITAAAGIPGKAPEAQGEREALAEELASLDYAAFTKEQWQDAQERLLSLEDGIESETELWCDLQQLLNYTLCIGLVSSLAGEARDARKQLMPLTEQLLRFALQGIRSGQWEPVPEEEQNRFLWLEGRLERYSADIMKLESALEALPEKDGEPYLSLAKAGKLMSTSAFAPLEETASETVTPELLEARRQELFGALEAAMAGKSRKYVRALMASVLKELPVFFDSHTEVMNYVLASLGGCKNLAEKNASLDLLWELYGE